MAPARPPLGDTHNFGRRVSRVGERIEKPRTLLWEWLLLSAESPLRRLLDRAATQDGLGPDAFAFLPDLRFFRDRPEGPGAVEALRLEPLPTLSGEDRRALARVVGRSLALHSWLGVSDLHWENLALGRSAERRLVLAPLDVELILDDLALPTETKLIPAADPEYAAICRHAAGVRRALPYLGKPVGAPELLALAATYHATLALLDAHAAAIARVFAELPGLREAPIRVCLRGTGDYVRARTAPVWPPLLDAEAEQLARGDIPYFFRLYGQPGLHYYGDAALARIEAVPEGGDAPELEPLLPIERGLRSPRRARLREQGLLVVLAAFDHPGLTGEHRGEGLTVSFDASELAVALPGGGELAAPRDLGAVVGSVYLPCRCGEVRAVFVPPVTVCSAGPRGGTRAGGARGGTRAGRRARS